MPLTHLPTVKFVLPSVTNEAGVLTYFLMPGSASSNWCTTVFNRHPDLEKRLVGCTDKETVYRACNRYAKKYRQDHKIEFEKSLKKNEKVWRPIEKNYLQTLSDHFEIAYPTHRKVMKAYVSMVPIYPRYLSEWSFNVSYFVPERVTEIACHEIQHFLFFKKWLTVFPETKFEELNHSHLVWLLSELIDPVILNEHPEFKRLFTRKQQTYKHFQKIRIEGKQPTTHLAIMYRRYLKSNAPFEKFLRDIWKFAQENKHALMAV